MRKRIVALLLAIAAVSIVVPCTTIAYADDADIQQQSLEPGSNIYLNGKTGDDANDGSETAPVKTFAQAKKLMEQYGSDIIYISGTVTIDGSNESWDLAGKTLMRDGDFTGELVHLQGGAL